MRSAACWLALTLLSETAAAQQGFEPVTDNNFTIDLYQGPVLGSTRIIGMGGAQVSLAEGAAGLTANPAAPAVRPATSNDRWDWDFSIDWLNPEIGTDFDNNGDRTEGEKDVDRTLILSAGLVGNFEKWALGINAGIQQFTLERPEQPSLELQFSIAHISLSRSFRDDTLVAGIGARVGTFELAQLNPGSRPARDRLFSLGSSALEAGAVWAPKAINMRAGVTGALATKSKEFPEGCDPLDCSGYILPGRVEVPWTIAAGVSWRFADTPWNRRIRGRWRDERSLTLAADAAVTGPVKDGYGIEQYALHQRLQPSGRNAVVSVRAGAEYEWLPGRLRVRGGTYYEPPRFAEIGGRVHVTLGMELRVWAFCFWRERYRLRIAPTFDIANHYANAALSIGLWH